VTLTDSTITRIDQYGIQARDRSKLDLKQITISELPGPGLVLSGNPTGSAQKCKFTASQTVGGEFRNVNQFEITDCEFSGHGAAGATFRDNNGITLKNCVFASNVHVGADVLGQKCAPKFTGCKFHGNSIGINVTEGAAPTVSDSTVTDNSKFGVSIVGANSKFSGTHFLKSGDAAIALSEGGQSSFSGCTIQENPKIGCQVQSKGTTADFTNCKFFATQSAVAIAAVSEGAVRCNKCTLESTSSRALVEASLQGTCLFAESDLSGGSAGVGLQASEKGVLQFHKSNVHGKWKYGVLVAPKGICQGAETAFTDGQGGGICVQQGSAATFQTCRFERNGQLGLHVQGSVKMVGCTVAQHAQCGIYVEQPGQLSETDTKYANNGQQNVVRK
jgi:hypothetical protein